MENQEPHQFNGFTPYPDLPDAPDAMSPLKHSGPGIASFILVLLAIIGYIVSLALVTVAVVSIADQPIEVIAESMMNQMGALLGVLLMMVSAVFHLAALILGVIGLAIKNRKKLFAILGVSFSGGSLLLLIFLFTVGSLM
ncbi:hypothetical protein LBW89_01945 [Paenibacillus sp. alder61]|uniref:DUF4064 domain-containing protein n=1 Tax=Paenibacillus faecis TaxID=862114 RepID=A0A5D0CZ31_9BACL|nr:MULTISPECIES: hypothetical protein [Paenibacillus]MCA1291772.1 hypothetical protein [Paenibacillus sp. alder61]TYA14990.1 hypothetical protein FRY98_04820 [Paenibacillus faecis]